MVHRSINIFVMLLFCLSVSPVYSQSYEDGLTRSVKYFSSDVLPVLKQLSSNNEEIRIDEIEIITKINPADIKVPLAFSEDGRRFIIITTGFLDALYSYTDVLLLQGQYDRKDLANKYFDYYIGHVLGKNKKPPVPTFQYFLPKNKRSYWLSDKDIENARSLMFMSAVINILSHEVAHHALDNLYSKLTPYAIKKQSELDADQWAYKKLDASGEAPALGAVIAAGMILQYERYQDDHGHSGLRHHPAPVDRAKAGWKRTCSNPANSLLQATCVFLGSIIKDLGSSEKSVGKTIVDSLVEG